MSKFSLSLRKIYYDSPFTPDEVINDLKLLRYDYDLVYPNFIENSLRYNVISGGRASTKTLLGGSGWIVLESFDTSLSNTKFICLREYQKSIALSTYSSIKSLIFQYRLSKYFHITDTYIHNKYTNITINFEGCQNYLSLKSSTIVSRAWFEEMEKTQYVPIKVISDSFRWQNIAKTNYTKMLYTYNPNQPIDPIRQFINDQNTLSVRTQFKHITIYDLPPKFVNEEMLLQAQNDKLVSPELHDWAWLGKPHATLSTHPFKDLKFAPHNPFQQNQLFDGATLTIDPSYTGQDYTAVSIITPNNRNGLHVIGYCFKLSWQDALPQIHDLVLLHNIAHIYYEPNGVGDEPKKAFASNYSLLAHRMNPTSTNKVARITKLPFYLSILDFYVDTTSKLNYASKEYQYQFINYEAKQSNASKGVYDDAPDSLVTYLEFKGYISK